VSAQGEPRLVVHGPMAQGMSVSPDGDLFVADRRASQLFALSPDGTRVDLARFTEGDAPRGIAFAPVTPETRAAGIAGSLFVVVIRRSAWPVNEVIRISGPFSDHIRAGGR
jgi:DNA-binding beta-propeller fold protein YncE